MNTLQVKNFLNTGFRSFSTYDCATNIPNLMDGLKVSGRKCMYTIVNKNKKNSVERFAAEIASFTSYHHGAGSLEGVLVGLAQDFPTSNNVNFLTPIGQFGNILNGAAASGRYISVELNSNFRKWFKKEDDLVLEYEYEDGEQIEPKYFVPIVPTILFNGVSGIGTGYACKILNYNPVDIVSNVRKVLDNKKQDVLTPWYQGYKGTVTKIENQTIFKGTFERVNSTTLKITALPIGYDLDSYKDHLTKLIDQEIIKDYDDNSTKGGWNILIHSNRALLALDDAAIIDKLKLVSRESENITVWTEENKIKCFNSPEELIEHFVKVRLNKYNSRLLKLIGQAEESIRWVSEKLRFILFYLDNVEQFKNKKKDDLVALLLKNKFSDYDRLLQMTMWNLTREKIEELKAQIAEEKKYLALLKADTAAEMYKRELKELKV